MGVTIEGLQLAQDEANRLIAADKSGRVLEQGTRFAVSRMHRYRVSITHVDTGSLRGATRQEVRGLNGRVFIDATARNNRTGANVRGYAETEEARGGSHAAAARTVSEQWPRVRSDTYRFVSEALGFGN